MSEQKRQTNFGLSSGIGVSPVLGSNFAATGNQQRSTCNTPPIRVGPCLSVVQSLQPATSAIPTASHIENHTKSHHFSKKHVFDFMNHSSHPDTPGAKRSETGLPGEACEAGSNPSQTGVQPGSNLSPTPVKVQSRLVKASQAQSNTFEKRIFLFL